MPFQNKGADGGYDMNIHTAWEKGYTGRDLDDGIEYTHEDFIENYVSTERITIDGRDLYNKMTR